MARFAQRHERALLDEVSGLGVTHDHTRVANRLQIASDDFVEGCSFRAGDLDDAATRSLIRKQRNLDVVLAEVSAFDLAGRRVLLSDGRALRYDQLLVAAGAGHAYFGRPDWARFAPGLKTIEDALEIRYASSRDAPTWTGNPGVGVGGMPLGGTAHAP